MTPERIQRGARQGSAVVTLPSETEMEITRVFDAPARTVFQAFTTPELVRRWWAEEEDEWIVCVIDLRPGGRWRWVFRHGQIEVGFHGEYREVSAPHRLVYTELFEMPRAPLPEDASPLTTLSLAEKDAVTTMSLRSQYPSVELRDLVLASGMEEGMQRSYDRLDAVVCADGPSHV
jgi:uncharacterized protein YndB with AHSA1/START domain